MGLTIGLGIVASLLVLMIIALQKALKDSQKHHQN